MALGEALIPPLTEAGLGKLGAAFDRLPDVAAFCEAHRND